MTIPVREAEELAVSETDRLGVADSVGFALVVFVGRPDRVEEPVAVAEFAAEYDFREELEPVTLRVDLTVTVALEDSTAVLVLAGVAVVLIVACIDLDDTTVADLDLEVHRLNVASMESEEVRDRCGDAVLRTLAEVA